LCDGATANRQVTGRCGAGRESAGNARASKGQDLLNTAARPRRLLAAGAAAASLVLTACGSGIQQSPPATVAPPANTIPTSTQPTNPGPAAKPSSPSSAVDAARVAALPRPSHVVVVVEENHAAANILGSSSAPYINHLARIGASFTRSYAITHPSEPNYVALFSGSQHGLTDDSCPHTYSGANLGSQLRAAGKSFRGYAEGLPRAGYRGCSLGEYARKHVPWTDFANLPGSVNQPLSAFGTHFSRLPTLSFVIPNLAHDMHDGTITQGDQWLRRHLSGYVTWARSHNSLLVLTWDEDDTGHGNLIPTIIVGAHVKAGRYGEHVTHYRMLRTVEALERLAPLGHAAGTSPITDIWTS
jgi:acid phosphatase